MRVMLAKSSVAISLLGPMIASLVAPFGQATIYVCGFKTTISSAAFSSVSFGYSATAACTTPTAITGQLGLNSTSSANTLFIGTDSGNTLFSVPAGNGLCVTVTGGIVQGNLTYVQQ